MTTESIPIKLYFELTDTVNGTLPLPRCTIKINGKIVVDNEELTNSNNETTPWQADKKISVKSFNVDIDDDIESENTIEVLNTIKQEEVWDILPENPDLPGGKIDYGFFLRDIEINEISVESLVYDKGDMEAVVCPESEFETHGLLDYLRGCDQINEVSIVDGNCVWTTKSNYFSIDNQTYSFKFKTPIYMWLLELLLQ